MQVIILFFKSIRLWYYDNNQLCLRNDACSNNQGVHNSLYGCFCKYWVDFGWYFNEYKTFKWEYSRRKRNQYRIKANCPITFELLQVSLARFSEKSKELSEITIFFSLFCVIIDCIEWWKCLRTSSAYQSSCRSLFSFYKFRFFYMRLNW